MKVFIKQTLPKLGLSRNQRDHKNQTLADNLVIKEGQFDLPQSIHLNQRILLDRYNNNKLITKNLFE